MSEQLKILIFIIAVIVIGAVCNKPDDNPPGHMDAPAPSVKER